MSEDQAQPTYRTGRLPPLYPPKQKPTMPAQPTPNLFNAMMSKAVSDRLNAPPALPKKSKMKEALDAISEYKQEAKIFDL